MGCEELQLEAGADQPSSQRYSGLDSRLEGQRPFCRAIFTTLHKLLPFPLPRLFPPFSTLHCIIQFHCASCRFTAVLRLASHYRAVSHTAATVSFASAYSTPLSQSPLPAVLPAVLARAYRCTELQQQPLSARCVHPRPYYALFMCCLSRNSKGNSATTAIPPTVSCKILPGHTIMVCPDIIYKIE